MRVQPFKAFTIVRFRDLIHFLYLLLRWHIRKESLSGSIIVVLLEVKRSRIERFSTQVRRWAKWAGVWRLFWLGQTCLMNRRQQQLETHEQIFRDAGVERIYAQFRSRWCTHYRRCQARRQCLSMSKQRNSLQEGSFLGHTLISQLMLRQDFLARYKMNFFVSGLR